jgi:hypothetical protein
MRKRVSEVSDPSPDYLYAMKLQTVLEGIAACATQCVCCEMHRQIAEKALGYTIEVVTDTIPR